MGNYITISTLTSRVGSTLYGQLLGVTGVDATTLGNAIISRAEGRVNAYLSSRYTVPVTGNGFVEEIAMCLAEYELYKRGDWPDVPEKIKSSFEKAMEELKSIANGDIDLPVESVASDAGAWPLLASDDEVYSDESMSSF